MVDDGEVTAVIVYGAIHDAIDVRGGAGHRYLFWNGCTSDWGPSIRCVPELFDHSDTGSNFYLPMRLT